MQLTQAELQSLHNLVRQHIKEEEKIIRNIDFYLKKERAEFVKIQKLTWLLNRNKLHKDRLKHLSSLQSKLNKMSKSVL